MMPDSVGIFFAEACYTFEFIKDVAELLF